MCLMFGLKPTKPKSSRIGLWIKRKYLRFEQMEVFRPMPVPQSLEEQIRQEADRAKAMAKKSGLDKVGQRVQTNYESKTNGV